MDPTIVYHVTINKFYSTTNALINAHKVIFSIRINANDVHPTVKAAFRRINVYYAKVNTTYIDRTIKQFVGNVIPTVYHA